MSKVLIHYSSVGTRLEFEDGRTRKQWLKLENAGFEYIHTAPTERRYYQSEDIVTVSDIEALTECVAAFELWPNYGNEQKED